MSTLVEGRSGLPTTKGIQAHKTRRGTTTKRPEARGAGEKISPALLLWGSALVDNDLFSGKAKKKKNTQKHSLHNAISSVVFEGFILIHLSSNWLLGCLPTGQYFLSFGAILCELQPWTLQNTPVSYFVFPLWRWLWPSVGRLQHDCTDLLLSDWLIASLEHTSVWWLVCISRCKSSERFWPWLTLTELIISASLIRRLVYMSAAKSLPLAFKSGRYTDVWLFLLLNEGNYAS